MMVTHASIDDAGELAALESVCFPSSEAASLQQITDRIAAYPECFWVLREDGAIVAAVNGMATDIPDLEDEMFADASIHNAEGAWQMIFSVATLPERRGEGLASLVLMKAIADAQSLGRAGVVLTCKDALVGFYERFGFVDEGIGASRHGGVPWHQMRLSF